jgi:hypothetical protein
LTKPETINKLIDILTESDLLDNYVLLVKQLANGSIPPTNMAVMAALERAKLSSLKSSTAMVYDKRWKQFCQVLYRVIKGKGIRYMSGSGHRGQVLKGESRKGVYIPSKGKFNFAIPTTQILSKGIEGMPNNIPPGIIGHTIHMLDKSKQHHIAVDGKRITQGLSGTQLGDVHMWGLEGPPSLEQQHIKLQNFKEKLKSIEDEITDQLQNPLVLKVRSLLKDFTLLLRELRENRLDKTKRLSNLQTKAENNKDKNYQLAISSVRSHLLRSANVVRRCLASNKSICSILANVQLTPYLFAIGDNVQLSNQVNMKMLHDIDTVSQMFDITTNTHIVKQYTEQWRELRKQARVTGSSAHNAIGLRGKKEMDQHYNHYVNKVPMAQNPPEVQKRMDHGTQNEIHGIATLASVVMPALFPHCAVLYEEGLSFVHSPLRPCLMAVSPDGYIGVCNNSETCYHPSALFHMPTAVEVKCPYPNENQLPVHYDIPTYYAIQLLAEMKCKGTTSAIYCSYSEESTTVIHLHFDDKVWDRIWKLIETMYGSPIPTREKTVPSYKKHLLQELEKYIKDNSQIVAEVPSCKGTTAVLNPRNATGPYHTPPTPDFILTSSQSVANDIKVLCANSIPIVEEGFQLLREKASEILAFIITDTDRKFSTTIPPHMPLAYAMKGRSLSIATFRQMMRRVRIRCQESEVRVITEAYDGQWAMMIMKSINGKPLTRIQLGKEMWKTEKKRKKLELLKELEKCSNVSRRTLHQLAQWVNGDDPLDFEDFLLYKEDGALHLDSNRQMKKIWTSGSPQIWSTASMKVKLKAATQLKANPVRPRPRIALETEIDVLKTTFMLLPASDPMSIFSHILAKLQEYRDGKGTKWTEVGQTALQSEHLSSHDNIGKLLVPDLNCIANAVKEFSGMLMFVKSKLYKWEKVDMVNKLFGNGVCKGPPPPLPPKQPKRPTKEKPHKEVGEADAKKIAEAKKIDEAKKKAEAEAKFPKLSKLARMIILKTTYPKEALAAAVCCKKYRGAELEWETKSTVPLTVPLPFLKRIHKIYWYPERDEAIDELLLRSLDPSHLLTNLRTAITQKGALGLTPEDYSIVCEAKVLRRVTIEDNLDQQNVSLAKDCFSEKVENCLKENSRWTQARVVGIIRRWYEACDDRGLPAKRRAKRLQEMTDLLTEKIDFSHFPPPGNNVEGVPLITYEGILQSNTLRMLLYGFCDNGTFNHRAISTLAAESFFSDLTALEFTTTGCPKAVQIPTLLAQVTQMNQHKHDPDKFFFMELSNKSVYPTHLMDSHEKDANDATGEGEGGEYFKSHEFDEYVARSERRKTSKSFKINPPDSTARGTRGIRQHYRVDQSKIPDLEKL